MLDLTPEKKIAGVLAPVFALRGKDDLGIGDTAALREFATWAAGLGLRAVQILPVNETGCDNSPYNIISSIAIDPATIATHPAEIPDLTEADFARITKKHDLATLTQGSVRYSEVKALKDELLRAAFDHFRTERGRSRRKREFAAFEDRHAEWLHDYGLYRALVSLNHDSEVMEAWPDAHRTPAGAREWLAALPAARRREIEDLIRYHAYVQWIAFSQWDAVRDHCHRLGVALIGDIPVGVSIYSCDVWSEPHIFDISRSSGAPPETNFKCDLFTEKWGQNWGFPLYDWQQMSHDNFAWWRRRLRITMEMVDLIRIDHALGFFRIYSFPWRPAQNATFTDLTEDEAKALTGGRLPGFEPRDDSTPENRERNRRHGDVLFRIMLEETGPHRLIAEDLGSVSPYVRPVLETLEIPGFKIPQWERNKNDGSFKGGESYQRLSLATYATHDHPPVRAFWNDLNELAHSADAAIAEEARDEMREFMRFAGAPGATAPRPFDDAVYEALMRGLFSSNSWLAVPMITDLLGTDERFNVPGAYGEQNWTCRLACPTAQLSRNYAPKLDILEEILRETGRLHD